MSQYNILLTASQIHDGLYCDSADIPSQEEILRSTNPALTEAYTELKKAREKYNMLLKLLTITDRFR